ncbi:MAG TPA: LD-carboxypeptidase [Firmicutes bacterium]|nr:LD-carboxypeptidase [Candidatus Fermentithermobacillaceae bacterium]
MIKPKALKFGDTLGLIAPASNTTEENVQKSIKKLVELGFKVREGKSLYKRHGFLAGDDQTRAQDINEMFADPEVDGIICIRGGTGAPRILELLDYDVIKKNPKVFIGYSDITVLHIAFNQICNLVTFHGPMVSSNMIDDFDDYSKEGLFRLIMDPDAYGKLENPEGEEIVTINSGIGIGQLAGGCLALVCSTLGTPYEIDTKGKILVLEDLGEEPYKVDRMLNQLRLAGKLQEANGIILGTFEDSAPKGGYQDSQPMEEVFDDHLKRLGVPAIYNLRIGHCKPVMTIPLGVYAKLDADKKEIHLLENATTRQG